MTSTWKPDTVYTAPTEAAALKQSLTLRVQGDRPPGRAADAPSDDLPALLAAVGAPDAGLALPRPR